MILQPAGSRLVPVELSHLGIDLEIAVVVEPR